MNLRDRNDHATQFLDLIMELPVFDTHTHLVGERLAARDFWEIAHYFWLNQELQAGGYPADAEKLPEEERIAAFLEAYHCTRSTLMNWVFTAIMRDLYGIKIKDEYSMREAITAVRQSAVDEGWAQRVADRMNIRRFVVNHPEHADFLGMRDQAVLIPRIDGTLGKWIDRIVQSEVPATAYLEIGRAHV